MLEWLGMELWIAAGLLITFSPNTHLPFANLHTYAHRHAHTRTQTRHTCPHTSVHTRMNTKTETHWPTHLDTLCSPTIPQFYSFLCMKRSIYIFLLRGNQNHKQELWLALRSHYNQDNGLVTTCDNRG